jgi:hypothetical protein
MDRKYITLMVGLGLLPAVAPGQIVWRHQKLQSGLFNVFEWPYCVVNGSGKAAYTVETSTGMNVFLGPVNYSTLVYGGPNSSQLRGIAADGDPIWLLFNHLYKGNKRIAVQVKDADFQDGLGGHLTYVATVAGRDRAFIDETDVTTPALGETGIGVLAEVPNAYSVFAWRGKGPGTDGYYDVFKSGVNLSKNLLGANRYAYPNGTMENGQSVWNGRGDLTGGIYKYKVFVDTFDLTTNVLGQAGSGTGSMNNNHVLWFGGDDRGPQIFLDSRSVTAPVVGISHDMQLYKYNCSADGKVLWGVLVDDGIDLYVESYNLSRTVLGHGMQGEVCDINASGHVAWTGEPVFPQSDVFYDKFNLSQDALGAGRGSSIVMAIGDGGHFLWKHANPATPNRWDVWLSTPIPARAVPIKK